MNIDILEDIIKISSNKKNTLLYFLDNNIVNKIKNYDLINNTNKLYLKDKLYCIRKDTLELEYYLTINYVKDNIIGLQKNKNYTININANNYYLFLKSINNKNNRKYFEELLKQMQ